MTAVLEKAIAPPNSVVFIADPTHRFSVPEIGPGLVWSSVDCVAVGTLYEGDGETTFILSSRIEERSGEPVFSGLIGTPGRTIAILTATGETILASSVQGERTRLSIWANDASEPDLILVEASGV